MAALKRMAAETFWLAADVCDLIADRLAGPIPSPAPTVTFTIDGREVARGTVGGHG